MYALNAFPTRTSLKAVESQKKLDFDVKRATEMADRFIKCVDDFIDLTSMRRLLAELESASKFDMAEKSG